MSFQETWRQIPVGVKMSLGVRDAAGDDNPRDCRSSLTFKVGNKPMYYVEIKLDYSDTYTVTMLRLKRPNYDRIIIAQVNDVYADSLGRVLLGMERHLV